jgi:hypothetical protein
MPIAPTRAVTLLLALSLAACAGTPAPQRGATSDVPATGAPATSAPALPVAIQGSDIDATAVAATRIDPADITIAERLRDEALVDNLAFMLLASLTTEVGHRLPGSPNDARAQDWAEAAFRRLGFDKVYREPVTFPRWFRNAESVAVVSPWPQRLVATALGGSVGTDGPIEAEVVEFATLDALGKATREEVEGRIVFIGNRMTAAIDGAGYGPAVRARTQGPSIAAGLGARALLIRSIGTSNNRFAHTGVISYDPAKPRVPAASISNPDADLLRRMFERGQRVVVRMDLDVGFDGEYTSNNIIGEITGSEFPDQVVAIGGHLDSWDKGTGALDDGAGCAITMAAAHQIIRAGLKPKRTIRVVLFANEEQGLWGGKVYAENRRDQIHLHQVAGESDFGAGRVWRFDTRVKPEAFAAARQIHQVLEPLGIRRGLNTASGGPDFTRLRELDAAVFTLAQDGSAYFDYHHTDNDTLDKVKPADLNQNVAAWVAAVWMFAQANGNFGSGSGLDRAPSTPR